EQARLARETGGIFFMLPSLETNLLRGEKREYELEMMRPYLPDIRSRQEYMYDQQRSNLRMVLWKIINDLNPYRKENAEIMNMRDRFTGRPEEFIKQANEELNKLKIYVTYLHEAEKALRLLKQDREQETD